MADIKKDTAAVIDEILAREISRRAMPLTRWVVKRTARSLTTEKRLEILILPLPVEKAREDAHSKLSRLGRIRAEYQGADGIDIRVIIGAGSMNLNPAVIDLMFIANSSTECSIQINSAAKEGLIKQQTASGAIQRVVQVLIN